MMEISTEKFQGPLGILLQMIEAEKMDITEISLAAIADQYVRYIETAANIGAEEMADFLLVAAKLLYIKSKALLPYLQLDEEEEEDLGDLEKQLRMYKEFVEASERVAEILEQSRFLYVPDLSKTSRRGRLQTPAFNPPKSLTVDNLAQSMVALVARLLPLEPALEEKKLEPKISLEERIARVREVLAKAIRFSFSRLIESSASKTEVIVSFLAILELAKQKEIVFEQNELFAEIIVSRRPEEN